MDLDLDAIAKQVADAIQTGEWESAYSFLAELGPAQIVTVKAKVLGKGADPATVETLFGSLQEGEVIHVSGRAPSRVTLLGILVLIGLGAAAYATHRGVKRRRRRA